MDMGLGIQISNAKIQNSSYSYFVQTPNPKLFLGLGVEHKINKKLKICWSLNANPSKIETQFKYHNDTAEAFYKETNSHRDINYGLALGVKYSPISYRKGLSISSGLNFQRISPWEIISTIEFSSGKDSFSLKHDYSYNDFSKQYNSLLYYLNISQQFGKKRKYETVIEYTTTLNKPIFGSDNYYFNEQLIEKSYYRVNMMFLALKLRRQF